MEPLLPSLHNLPAFYTVVIALLLMAGLSAYALYRRLRQRPPGAGFTRLKVFVLLPLWVLCLIWTGVAVFAGVIAGGSGGSLLFVLLALGLLPVFALLTWGLYFWVRSRTLADAGVLLLVPVFFLTVYTVQRQWLCEPLAFSGVGRAQLCTARLYERGEGGALRHRGAAREWYRAAAEQGVAEAEYEVAGFTRGREQKIVWYTRAAEHGHPGAAAQLYWLQRKAEPGTAVQRLQAAVRQGDAGAQYRLGSLYLYANEGVERDLQRTRELWQRAAGNGYISAMRSLAIAYAGDGVPFDHDPELSHHWEQQARELAPSKPDIPIIEQFLETNWERILQEVRARRALADAGDAAAQLAIGREILKLADTDPVLIDKAIGWIERAAHAGSVEARYQLANLYLDDEPVQEQGRDWLIAAADSGHEQALRKVITTFKEQTHGFPRDLQRSKAYSEALFKVLKARGVLANQPDWMTAGWEYNDTLKQIKKEASRYLPADELRQQSDAGDPAAQYHQAKEMMSTQFDESIALMTASATAGYPQAQFDMANRYRHRKRTVQEEHQIIDWLTAAAESGHRGAIVDLGSVYLRGNKRINLAPNPYQAKVLFEQALQNQEGVIYKQDLGNGRSWIYTVESVRRKLARVPETVQRLDLEGLQGAQRQQAIEQWYAKEQLTLKAQTPAADGRALDDLEQQRAALQKDL